MGSERTADGESRLPVPDARILIVDDEPQSVRLLERLLLRVGYTAIETAECGREALEHVGAYRPDLVLLDLRMPDIDGFEVLRALRARFAEEAFLPVLVLTGDHSEEALDRALSSGANDFLRKPFRTVEAMLRIRNLLETRALYRELEGQKGHLEARVAERTRELEGARIELLERLAVAAEYRDDETGEHTRRVGELAARVARELRLAEAEVALIRRAAPLHDVGKIGIPDRILLKPGRLSDREFAIIKTHTTIGASVLGGSNVPQLRLAEQVALAHHERWDGSGYPHGLAGHRIPLAARVVAVADVFDALSHDRTYRPAWPVAAATEEIIAGRGSAFDPEIVDAFLACVPTALVDTSDVA